MGGGRALKVGPLKKKLFVATLMQLEDIVCPRSLDPFYIVTNYIKWFRLLGHIVYVYNFLRDRVLFYIIQYVYFLF